jgi:hypothetical protein
MFPAVSNKKIFLKTISANKQCSYKYFFQRNNLAKRVKCSGGKNSLATEVKFSIIHQKKLNFIRKSSKINIKTAELQNV